MDYVTCECCKAIGYGRPPHGDQPCPFAVSLNEAEVADRRMHTELLAAQRDATTSGIRPGRRAA